MHKKVQALLVAGIMSINMIGSTGQVLANEIEIEKDIKVEKSSSEGEDIVVPEESEWKKTETIESLKNVWEYAIDGDKVILKRYMAGTTNPKVEIPRTIDGKKVELEGLNNYRFDYVTHLRIAKGNNDNKVKLRSNYINGYYGFYLNSDIRYLDLSGLDTEGLVNLDQGFRECPNLEYVNLSGWDVSKVDMFQVLFYNCKKLKYLDLSGWNIKESADMYMALSGTISLKEVKLQNINKTTLNKFGSRYPEGSTLDITNIDLEGATSLREMFKNFRVSTIKGLDTLDTSNVTDMSSMFKGCSHLTSIDGLQRWNTENLQNMGDMFDGCSALTDISAIANWNTSRVTNMNGLFLNCTNLESVKFGKNWNTANVDYMNNTFNNCQKLNFIDLTRWTVKDNTSMTDTFKTSSDAEDKRLLVVTDDERIKGYDFRGHNLLPVKVTVEANSGHFQNSSEDETRKSIQRFTIESNKFNDINNTIKEDIESLGQPTREGYTFAGWIMTKNPASKFDMLDMTYKATWKNVNNEEGSIIIPGSNGGEIIIKPNQDGQLPSYDEDGNINIPEGGVVELPNIGNVTAQGGTINPDSGEVILPNGGSIDLEGNGVTITIPNGGTINQDGSIIVPKEGCTVELLNGSIFELPSSGVINLENGSIELQNGGTITLPNGNMINPEVNIQIPTAEDVNLQDENGNNIIIKPGTDGQLPIINEDGNVILPKNGKVNLPNIGIVKVTKGGIVKPDGSIEMPNGGSVTLADGSFTFTVAKGSTLKPNGTIETPNGIITINPSGDTTTPGKNGDIILENGGLIELPDDAGSIKIPNGSIINQDGSITVPADGGSVEIPNGITVHLPSGGVINPEDGSIEMQNGGNIVLPNNGGIVVVPNGIIVKPNGSIEVQNGVITINPGGSITIPGKNGNDITLPPVKNEEGSIILPEISENGEISLPNGGFIELQGGAGSITIPNGSIINPEGNIQIPTDENLTLPGENGNNIIIKPGTGGQAPTINKDGNVIMPENGKVELPNIGTVIVPEGSTVKPNGSIEMPNGVATINPSGSITIPGENGDITLPPLQNEEGSVILPEISENGEITLPNGSLIELPGGAGSITLPNGSIINPEGNIQIPTDENLTLPGEDGNNIIIKPGTGGQAPTINKDGNVIMPENGKVELPNIGTVIVPEGSIVKPNGTIESPNGGTTIKPNGTVTVPGTGGDSVTIPPIQNEDSTVIIPTIDASGNVTMPENGTVTLPGDIEIEVPSGTIVSPEGSITMPETGGTVGLPNGSTVELPSGGVINAGNGSIEMPNGGNITLPNNGGTVTVPNGSTVKPNGSIEMPNGVATINPGGSITIPGENGDITLPPLQNEEGSIILPEISEDGEISLPNGGLIELPGGAGSITIPNGSIINQEGNITIPNGETVILPSGGEIKPPNGSIVKPNGDIVISGENAVIKPNGSIVIPGQSGESITIPVIKDDDGTLILPEVNEEGIVMIPNGGTVVLPGGEITVPENSTINSNGNITIPNNGNVTIPNYEESIKVPGGTTIKPNGSVIIPEGGSITIPNQNNNIVIKPNENGEAPTINPEGDITIPNGGSVELPSGTITLPNGSIMKPNGSIQTPNINNNGGIVITPEGNMTVSGGATVKPSEDGKLPEINEDGNVIVPETGGTIVLPESAGTVIVPGNSVVKPDGSIIVQEEGTVTLPNNGGTVTVKPGTVINSDGTIKDSKPSIFDKIDNNVVEVGTGDGQVNNPIILTIKKVDKTKLNAFLNTLQDLNPKVMSITKGSTHTEYKVEVDNKKVPFKEKTYVTIKVDEKQTDLVKALNKFSKGTNEKIEIPILVSFTDVKKHWAKTNIENFASMDLINGYEDGTFKPDASITRAEFVKIINSVFGYTQAGTVTFTDVKKCDWFYNEVAIAKQAGYINGKTETTFAPNDKITREEVAKILTTIMKNKDDKLDRLSTFPDGNKTSNWAKPYVEGAIEAGYLSGDTNGKLNPTSNITRAEAVTVLSRIKK